MCVKPNTEGRLWNHCCRGKAIHFRNFDSVFVALGTQHEKCVCHVVCSQIGCTLFYHIIINGTIFEKKKKLNIKCVFWFSLQVLPETFLSKMYIGLHVKYPLFFSYFNDTWISSTDFRKKTSNTKFHVNLSIGSGVIPCGLTDRQTDMMKLIVAFRSFPNAPKNLLLTPQKTEHLSILSTTP